MLNQLIKRGMKPRGVLCLDSRLDHVFLITQLDAISEKVWQRLPFQGVIGVIFEAVQDGKLISCSGVAWY